MEKPVIQLPSFLNVNVFPSLIQYHSEIPETSVTVHSPIIVFESKAKEGLSSSLLLHAVMENDRTNVKKNGQQK